MRRLIGFIFALGLLLVPSAAFAHDRLIESDPADGAVLESSPGAITLKFSSEILPISPAIRVTGADGKVAYEGTPEVSGVEVKAKLEKPLPAGEAKVAWRVVSSDGHPIDGVFAFTVKQGAENSAPAAEEKPQAEKPAADEAKADTAKAEPKKEDAAVKADAPKQQETKQESGSSLPAAALAVGGVVVVLAALYFLVMKGRKND
ncbi:copper resistance protein CopC [Dermabacteraceae bacterium TAE3-ERU27]|nr:copper resistance protein CopC [Dermabacteraceae bacterium TAE3-ERU27]